MNENFTRADGSKSCPNCGAPIVGDKCAYCGATFIDMACIDLGTPFWLKIRLPNGKIMIHKVYAGNVTQEIHSNDAYADISMEFHVIN